MPIRIRVAVATVPEIRIQINLVTSPLRVPDPVSVHKTELTR
jgi:hypothetical protein